MNPKKWNINCFRLAVIKCLLLYFFIFGFNYIGFSQKEKKFKFLDKKDTVSKKAGFFLFPLLYYTPDTRIAAGLAGVYYFNTGRSDLLQKTRLSYTKLLCDYTQNKQLDFWTSWNIFTNQEKYLLKGEFRYRNFPDKFYGIGNSSNILNLEKYTYDLFKFKLLAMRQVASKFFIGLDYQYENQFNFSHQVGGELETGSLTGYKGGIGSALGLVATHDTRDNVVNAYSGHILEFSSYLNSSYLGGSFNYVNLNFKFGKYWELKKNNILAVNVQQGGSIEITGENADIKINGKSMKTWMEKVEERLNILAPNPELEREWDDLRRLGERYRKLEKKCKEKAEVWNKLKAMPKPEVKW